MRKVIFLLLTSVLAAGCDNASEEKEAVRKAADQSALQGQFKPSEPLDYSKYIEPAPAPKPVKSQNKKLEAARP